MFLPLMTAPRIGALPCVPHSIALACCLSFCAPPLWAQTPPEEPSLKAVTVTGRRDITAPSNALSGEALTLKQSGTLGATLDGTPGVAATSFGPNASRPILRGLDGDRARVTQNGGASVDAASLSYDHAVPIEPLTVERIEVIRGAGALLYGTNTLGGVVNVQTNQIPLGPIDTLQGRAETRVGGAENERAAAAVLETGNGQWAAHVDVSDRKTSDLRIPGYARSAALRASAPLSDEPRDRLPNSAAEQQSAGVGVAYTGSQVNLGLSYNGLRSTYGTVAEPNVKIRMQQDRFALQGDVRDVQSATGGWFDSVKLQASYTDYQHRELDSGVVGTTFLNRGWETRLEARQAKRGNWDGSVGVQAAQTQFSALGEEAFVPSTRTQQFALFGVENWRASEALKFTLGGRLEHAQVQASSDGKPQFSDVQRSFTGGSAALGAQYQLSPALSLTSNLAYGQRLPTFYELYANGQHVATGAYEVGNAQFGKETSTSLDLGMKWAARGEGVGLKQASANVYVQHIDQYIGLYQTGVYRLPDGTVVSNGTSGALPEMAYQAVPAKLMGFEANTLLRVADHLFGSGTLDWSLRSDLTRATRRDTGEALPRIAPLRLGSSLVYRQAGWSVQGEVQYSAKQNQVPQGDLPTAAYTTVGLALTYRWRAQGLAGLVYLKGENLTNAEVRQATSILRDSAPMGGRAVRAGLQVNF